jgi:hypothetical protein
LNGGLSLSKSVYLCRVPEKPHPSHIIDLILTPFRSLIICSFLHLRQINGTPVYSLMASPPRRWLLTPWVGLHPSSPPRAYARTSSEPC